jgi:hypothetical protein
LMKVVGWKCQDGEATRSESFLELTQLRVGNLRFASFGSDIDNQTYHARIYAQSCVDAIAVSY